MYIVAGAALQLLLRQQNQQQQEAPLSFRNYAPVFVQKYIAAAQA
jgi:hypothetical protein